MWSKGKIWFARQRMIQQREIDNALKECDAKIKDETEAKIELTEYTHYENLGKSQIMGT